MQSSNPTLTLKEKQRQAREELILDVAEEVFLEKGYYESSMDEIATRVGVAKGTVYLHFHGKEDLLLAILQRDIDAFSLQMQTVIASTPTVRAQLEAVIHSLYTGLYCKHVRLLASLYDVAEKQRLLAAKGERLRKHRDDLVALVNSLLEKGKAAGEFDATIETHVMVGTFFTLFSPRSYDRFFMEHQLTPEETIQQMGQIYFRGIEAKQQLNQ